MKKEKLQQAADYEKYILEELPRDPKLQRIFQKAVEEKQNVTLVVKGYRPMYQKSYPYGFNNFWINDYDDQIPVPTICCLAGVDPNLVQNAYFNFRNHERWPRMHPELDKMIFKAQKQVVTNLFPFHVIEWRRESGSTGIIYPIDTIYRTPPFLRKEEILINCQKGKIIAKSYDRHIRKVICERSRKKTIK